MVYNKTLLIHHSETLIRTSYLFSFTFVISKIILERKDHWVRPGARDRKGHVVFQGTLVNRV